MISARNPCSLLSRTLEPGQMTDNFLGKQVSNWLLIAAIICKDLGLLPETSPVDKTEEKFLFWLETVINNAWTDIF